MAFLVYDAGMYIKILKYLLATCLLGLPATPLMACEGGGVRLQVLGSGGPELDDGRASSGYLIWYNGHARILIDMGEGSLHGFEQSGANINDLDAILLTHLHVDHSADLPALVKAAFFSDRDRDLPVYGPTGNHLMPATSTFVQRLFASDGAYRYLADNVNGSGPYQLLPHDVPADGKSPHTVINNEQYKISAIPVQHGPIPALAWRVELNGLAIVVSGDMNGDNHTLEQLAASAEVLVAHHAIPEGTTGVARRLHMPPSVIGKIAGQARVKRLVLSHLMNRTLGRERASKKIIRQHYRGPVNFAIDRQCFTP